MAVCDPCLSSVDEHRRWLASQARLPRGFAVATEAISFVAQENGKAARMTMTFIGLDQPTSSFAGMFTRNAFPGAPVRIGRRRLEQASCSGLLINNKISNVCAPQGEADAEVLCTALAGHLGLPGESVIPSSTGIIGWRLPLAEMQEALPRLLAGRQSTSLLPAAEGIMTTDLYPKLRRYDFANGASLVGIAKGAGMLEPHLATMLVFLLTDAQISRAALRSHLPPAVESSFNAISIDSDQSTSDSVIALSSGQGPAVDDASFASALQEVCGQLAEDIVRNGEGVRHVQRVSVQGAPSRDIAKAVGKAVINSPLWKTALAGNDPNVGRLLMAVGKILGTAYPELPTQGLSIHLANECIFADGCFQLDPTRERLLQQALLAAELYPSQPASDGLSFHPPYAYPPHPRCVEISIDLACGQASCTVIGNDLTHEYVSENADYRS